MDLGRAEEWSATRRRVGWRVTLSTLLVVAVSAGFSSAGSDLVTRADATVAELSAPGQHLQEPSSERLAAWANEAIDSFEDDDLDCEQPLPPSVQTSRSSAASSSSAPRLASGEPARTYPARGPPSA